MLFRSISRLNPKRYDDDSKFTNLANEMVEDFEKNGKDLRKVKITSDNKKITISSSINIGESGSLIYIFGRYHPVKNNIHSGNTEAGNRRIETHFTPFSIVLKKNSIEKAFNTSRLNSLKIRVKDIKVKNNIDYNPNISIGIDNTPSEGDRKRMVRFHKDVEEYKVSPDIAGKVLKYFIDQYNEQYPDLKDSKYKGPFNISDIDKGVSPIIKYISVFNKNGDSLLLGLRKGESEKEMKSMLKKMTKEEYDIFCKKRDEDIYKSSIEKSNLETKIAEEKWIDKMTILGEKYGIVINTLYGQSYDIRVYGDYEVVISFSTKQDEKKVNEILKKMVNENFNEYKKKSYDVRRSFSYDKDNLLFTRIILEND